MGDFICMKVEIIFSGVFILDLVLGGGLFKGRVIEIYGLESFGKIILVLYAIVEI